MLSPRRNSLLSNTIPIIDCLQTPAQSITTSESRSLASGTNTSDKATGFFGLPRELRDDIYDLLYLEDEHKPQGLDKAEIIQGPGMGYVVNTHASVPQARLIGPRFKAEYEERQTSRVVLTSNRYLNYFKPIRCPRISSRSTELFINFYPPQTIYYFSCLWCQGHLLTNSSCLDAIAHIIRKMPSLEHIRIGLYCPGIDLGCTENPQDCAFDQFCSMGLDGYGSGVFERLARYRKGRVVDHDRLRRVDLEISWYGREDDSSEEDVRFATWTSKSGLQTDVDAAKRCKKNIVRV